MSSLSRRSFLSGTLAWTTVLLAGCGAAATAPASPSASAGSTGSAAPAGSAAAAKPAGSAAASPAPSAKPSAPGTAAAVKGAWVAITANQMLWPLAVEAGYFDKYGVNFALQYIQGSVTSVQSMVANEIQMAEVSGSTVVSTQAVKQDLIMPMGFLNQTVWRVLGDSSIKSIEDLKGKTIAVTKVGNSDYFAWTAMANRQGWKIEDFKFVNANDTPGQVTLLSQGGVQAISVSPPNDVQAEKNAKAHLVVDEADWKVPSQQVGMSLMRSYLAQNRATALNVAKATVEAIHRWKTDPEFAKKVIAKYLKSDDQAYIDAGYNAYAPLFPDTPYPTKEGFAGTIEEVATQTPAAKSVTPEQCMDTSLVKELEDSGFIKQIFGSSASGAASAAAKPAASGGASAAAKPSGSAAASAAASAKPAASASAAASAKPTV
jgi:NitT/TauT family transport system substrate-binding protein